VFRFLTKYFLRGLLVVVPAAATFWILYRIFVFVDQLVRLPQQDWTIPFTDTVVPGVEIQLPGVGVIITFVLILGIGFLASNVVTRWFFLASERLLTRMPGVKLLYGTIKDLIKAFVSEEKKFDKPVFLRLSDEAEVDVIGFITRESLTEFGREDRIAVYVPQSYNFAANLIVVPTDRVTPINLPAADVMAFVVSGGVVSGVENRDSEDD